MRSRYNKGFQKKVGQAWLEGEVNADINQTQKAEGIWPVAYGM